jgi:hypothetical protein
MKNINSLNKMKLTDIDFGGTIADPFAAIFKELQIGRFVRI